MSATRLHFSIILPRTILCPICANELVSRSIIFVDAAAFCGPCGDMVDSHGRRYATLVNAKRSVHQDHENWSTCMGLCFYTPREWLLRQSYMLIDPDTSHLQQHVRDVPAQS
jgi:hypothetical protein